MKRYNISIVKHIMNAFFEPVHKLEIKETEFGEWVKAQDANRIIHNAMINLSLYKCLGCGNLAMEGWCCPSCGVDPSGGPE